MKCCLYLRVSRRDQTPENQLPALKRIAEARGLEVVEVVIEKRSGAKKKRPGLDQVMKGAHEGQYQVVLVWAIDRLGRSMATVVETITSLDRLGVQVVSHQEPWLDTRGPVRELLISIFAWVAQQERERNIERTLCGIETARSNGKTIGRPKVTLDMDEALKLRKQGLSIEATAKRLGCGVGTLCRALKAA